MKFFSIAAFASAVMAAPSGERRDASPLDVKIEMVSNSAVKAVVTNTGNDDLKVLKTGSILDNAPVEKAHVTQDAQILGFDGVRLTIALDNLVEDAFQVIAAGESVEVTFDVAEVHDLSVGGTFEISTSGAFSVAEANTTTITGSVSFDSGRIEAEVDGEEASLSRIAFHQKRTAVQSDCTGTRLTAIRSAISGCASLATLGQNAATSGAAAKMTEFFKSSTTATRNTVAGVFSRVRSECGSTTGGVSDTYCTDVYSVCGSGGVIAYTVPSLSLMAYCPLFFNQMPASSTACYGQARDNTVLHEATHLEEVAGTDDFGGYGYNFVRSLSASQNLRHADTYTLFAQSLKAGC